MNVSCVVRVINIVLVVEYACLMILIVFQGQVQVGVCLAGKGLEILVESVPANPLDFKIMIVLESAVPMDTDWKEITAIEEETISDYHHSCHNYHISVMKGLLQRDRLGSRWTTVRISMWE